MILNHYLELLQGYRWHVLFIIVFSTLAFGGAGYYQVKASPQYRAAATVLLIPSQAELEFSLGGRNTPTNRQNLTETYMEYVTSRPVIETALAKVDQAMQPKGEEDATSPSLAETVQALVSTLRRDLTIFNKGTYVELPEQEKRLREIQEAISVANVASTQMMRIEVTLDDPDYAALVANTLAEAYVERVAAESNSDAGELEAYLQSQIATKETELTGLRAKQAQLIERYGLNNEFAADLDSQLRVEEAKLVELHSRLLTVNLSRASVTATRARLVEPAIAPSYALSPGVLSMSLIGLLVGLVLAAGSVIVRDLLTDTIKTSVDLHRLVGSRAIGLLPRSRLRLVSKRSFREFGLLVQQHFALARLSRLGQAGAHNRPRLPPPPPEQHSRYTFDGDASEVNGDSGAEPHVANAKPAPSDAPSAHASANYCFAQITGLASMETLCRTTIHMAAGLASIGNNVYCRLPDGVIKRPPRLKFSNKGEVFYRLPNAESGKPVSYVTVECLGPMNARFGIDEPGQLDIDSPLICVLPRTQIPERVVEAIREKIDREALRDWHFLLTSSTKRL